MERQLLTSSSATPGYYVYKIVNSVMEDTVISCLIGLYLTEYKKDQYPDNNLWK